jgi:hypothetical protein
MVPFARQPHETRDLSLIDQASWRSCRSIRQDEPSDRDPLTPPVREIVGSVRNEMVTIARLTGPKPKPA